jgi:UDP-N-acetylglucosamine acyltransferase
MMVNGNPAQCHGINSEGLRRRGFSAEQIAAAKQIHKLIYRQGLTLADARQAIEQLGQTQEAARDLSGLTLDFLAQAQRGIVR